MERLPAQAARQPELQEAFAQSEAELATAQEGIGSLEARLDLLRTQVGHLERRQEEQRGLKERAQREKARLEEAARGLGRTSGQVMLRITVPLMRSGVFMGMALVFLITMKELPATLILGPLGFKSLASAVWSASSEAFFAQAAAPAISLILLSSVPLAILMMRANRAEQAEGGLLRT